MAISDAGWTNVERDAMRRALALAQTPGVPLGPNPRVGCVLLSPDGALVAEGHHRGAGTAHAEVDALDRAGDRARGATAVVTLEPCNHTGRTGPCARALTEAGVTRVAYGQADPTPGARGGAAALAAAGVETAGGLLADEARALNPVWSLAVERRRPFVTWKVATTLDGRSAAADGTSRWISSWPSRRDTHRLRGACDVVMTGTGTVLEDDPRLTVRDDQDAPLPPDRQPLRVVVGRRDLSAGRRVLDDGAPTLHLRERDPAAVLARLHERGRHHVFLEGGATLAAAFVRAGLVDEVVAYVAPMLLGSGSPTIGDLGIASMTGALRLELTDVTVLGDGVETNVRLTMSPRQGES